MQTNNKVITVIIPTYNMEKYLRHCLDSLIVPNMDKVEVLVINDGSKDSSSAIGHEYQDKYPQTFRVIDKENGNYGSCVNRGLKEAKGKYVKVLDADDSFESENFSRFISKLETVNDDLILTDFDTVNEKGKVTDTSAINENLNIPVESTISFEFFSQTNPKYLAHMHEFTYKKSVFVGLGYKQLEGISYTDIQWCFEPISNVKTIYYIPMVIYKYLMGRQGQTMENQGKHIPQLIAVVNRMITFYSINAQSEIVYRTYLTFQIVHQLKNIYEMGLYRNAFPIKVLIEFDKNLAKFPYFYYLSNRIVTNKMLLIKMWRKDGKYHLPFWFRITRTSVILIKKRIKQILKSCLFLNKVDTLKKKRWKRKKKNSNLS